MNFLRRTPNWINHFPDESAREGLKQLAKASNGPFDKPREMNFSLYDFKDKKTLEEAAFQLSEQGWKCAAQPQADSEGRWVLTATKNGYCITEEQFTDDARFFKRIAKLYDAGYDGWFAST